MIKVVSSRELVQSILRHERGARVPKGELVLDDKVIAKSLDTLSIGFDERYEFAKSLGLDMIVLSPIYPKNSLSVDCSSLDINKWVNRDLFSFVILDGAFELGLRVFGFPEYLSMVMSGDEELEEFILEVEKINKETIAKLSDQGINGIIVADDIAFQDGLIVRPSIFRELFLPTLERQVKEIESRKMTPFFHSDGYYMSVMDDIVEAGFKGIHCIDRNCKMNVKDLASYSKKICLWGHLDINDINASDDENAIKSMVSEIKDATDFKGFILGTNSGLFPGMDVDGLKRIYDKVDEFVL